MDRVYALLVGIDAYQEPVPELFGCVNDVTDAQRYLLDAGVPQGDVRTLVDGAATKTAVVDMFRAHLGQAGPGDSVLFWYTGHGSTAPVLPAGWHLETSGTTMQTLVCADSRQPGGADLLDKELGLLIKEVAARGPHVVVVLDCCHSGGGTRTLPSTRARHTSAAVVAPEPAAMLPGVLEMLTAGGPPAAPDHVLLSACLDGQRAFERPGPDGEPRGVFSLGLLTELRRAGAPRTYRELVTAVLSFVENQVEAQTPGLYPVTEPIVDQPFLGGQVRPPVADMAMREVRGQWVIDVGSAHGMPPGDGSARVAVHGSLPPLEARLVSVGPARSVVEPVGWTPEPGKVYPVVLSAVAMPRTPVTGGGDEADDEAAAAEIRAAITAAGPGGAPSPYLRLVPREAAGEAAELVVTVPGQGVPGFLCADGAVLTTASAGTSRPAPGEVVRRLEHVARWRQIRDIRNPGSRLADLVRLQVIPAEPGDVRTPRERRGMPVGPHGVIELAYTGGVPPQMFLRLDSTATRPLHCVLLNLTDQFGIDAGMFPGGFLDAGASAAAGGGDPFEFRIPEDRLTGPCPLVQDWLMLIASEDQINPESFTLTRLGTPDRRTARGSAALDGIAEHFALGVHNRDAVRRPRTAGDWWTSVLRIVTRKPNGGASCH